MDKETKHFFQRDIVAEMPSVPDENGKFKSLAGGGFSITTQCNLDLCEYCYARTETSSTPYMSLEDFEKGLNWLAAVCDTPEITFFGGEPLIHPQFINFLDMLAERGWKGNVFTNGFFEKSVCDQLINHKGLNWICFHYDEVFVEKVPQYEERIFRNMEALSESAECQLTIVITHRDFDYETPFRLAEKYGLTLTWGFAAPTASNTPFVGLKTMREAGPGLQAFLLRCRDAGVKTAASFPFPMCIFDEDFLKQYKDEFGLVFKCRSLIYFKADLSTQFCSTIQCFSTPPLKSEEQVRRFIQTNRETDAALKNRTTFPECANCAYHLNAICQGGCMRYKLYSNPQNMV
jgi:radical SAM protein with 4Fe4S-binding SPASM domain